MKPSKTTDLKQSAEAYKDHRQAVKARAKAKYDERKETNAASNKRDPRFFDPNKYSLWI